MACHWVIGWLFCAPGYFHEAQAILSIKDILNNATIDDLSGKKMYENLEFKEAHQ
jgi:hypothetical protein